MGYIGFRVYGFPKLGVPFGFPIMRIIIFRGSVILESPAYGNYPFGLHAGISGHDGPPLGTLT